MALDLMILFFRLNSNAFEDIALNKTSLLLANVAYDNTRPTVLIIHGYTEDYRKVNSSARLLANAYIARGDHNILILDWTIYAVGDFFSAAIPNSSRVADTMARTFINMKTEGFKVETFHVVSHSLGSHLAGMMGRNVISYSNNTIKISRITGLDPSGVYWLVAALKRPLNKDDGEDDGSKMKQVKWSLFSS